MNESNAQTSAEQAWRGADSVGSAPSVPPAVPPNATPSATAVHSGQRGRSYGFLCSYCSSKLGADDSMAGQTGTCPTCGNSVVIPILDSRGRLIDPTSREIIKQDPHPVHAYAAAGHRAPQIVPAGEQGERMILCPKCQRQNPLSSNNCVGCGLPFTMEGTLGDSASSTNTWAAASLVLGVISVVGFCLVIPPVLAIVFGCLGLRSPEHASGQKPGQGLAVAGIVLGMIGLVLAGLVLSGHLR